MAASTCVFVLKIDFIVYYLSGSSLSYALSLCTFKMKRVRESFKRHQTYISGVVYVYGVAYGNINLFKYMFIASLLYICTHIEIYACMYVHMYTSILFINHTLNILQHLLPLIITLYYFSRKTLHKILSSHNIIQLHIHTYIHIFYRVIVNINHTTITTCIDKNLINFNLFLHLLSLSFFSPFHPLLLYGKQTLISLL